MLRTNYCHALHETSILLLKVQGILQMVGLHEHKRWQLEQSTGKCNLPDLDTIVEPVNS